MPDKPARPRVVIIGGGFGGLAAARALKRANVDVTLIAAWCELRSDYRHFRVERIQSSEFLEDKFPADNGRLLARWLAFQNARSDPREARPAGTSGSRRSPRPPGDLRWVAALLVGFACAPS